MKALYTIADVTEIEISGTAVEWVALALALVSDGVQIECDSVAEPAPYEHCSRHILIAPTQEEKLRIRLASDGDIVIQGNAQSRRALSQSIRNLANEFPIGSHIHIEYQGEEHFIAKGSLPAVFAHIDANSQS